MERRETAVVSWCHCQDTKFTHFKYTIQRFLINVQLCNNHHDPALEHFCHPSEIPSGHQHHSPYPLPPWQSMVCFLPLRYACFRHFISMESYSMWLSVPGFFLLASSWPPHFCGFGSQFSTHSTALCVQGGQSPLRGKRPQILYMDIDFSSHLETQSISPSPFLKFTSYCLCDIRKSDIISIVQMGN